MISTQVAQGLSISTACVPYLKPFLESLTSSVLDPNINSRLGNFSHQATTKPSVLRSWARTRSIIDKTATTTASGPGLPLQQFSEPASSSRDGDGNWEANSVSSQAHILEQNVLVPKKVGG